MAIRWRLEREIPAVWMDGCGVAHQLFLAVHGASNPAVFGSVARDQATARSDVDLLLTRVDLIRRRNLKPDLKALVEAEAIPLRWTQEIAKL